MPEVVWGENPETVNVCLGTHADMRHLAVPPAGVLLALRAEGLARVAIGVRILVVE